jgi:nucleoside-diphosphate-sugar epimerase
LKIFITGATGFVGGHFVNIVPPEIEIVAIRRSKSKEKIKLIRNVKWIEKEFTNLNLDDLNGVKSIFHFASTGVSPQKASWEELFNFNVNGTLSLLRIAADAGVRRVVMAGSFTEYGLSANFYKHIPTTATLLPITPYASSKAAAFELAYSFCINAKIKLVYNRIFSAYGEGQFEGNLWPSLRDAAFNNQDFHLTNGDQIRDFISIEEVALEFLKDLISKDENYLSPEIRNICTGNGVSILDFASFWWKNFKAKGQLLSGTKPNRKHEHQCFVGQPYTSK